MPRWVRKLLTFLAVFGILSLLWQGALFLSLLRPALVRSGITSAPEVPTPGFIYPSLGITAPVTVAPSTSPLETTSWSEIRRALTAGVSLSFDTDTVDRARLAFLTGHSSDIYPHAYSTIFAPLGQAQVGERFELRLDEATRWYTVVDRRILQPTAIDEFLALAPRDDQPQRLALVTCWPPLTTSQRLVILGEQVVE